MKDSTGPNLCFPLPRDYHQQGRMRESGREQVTEIRTEKKTAIQLEEVHTGSEHTAGLW